MNVPTEFLGARNLHGPGRQKKTMADSPWVQSDSARCNYDDDSSAKHAWGNKWETEQDTVLHGRSDALHEVCWELLDDVGCCERPGSCFNC